MAVSRPHAHIVKLYRTNWMSRRSNSLNFIIQIRAFSASATINGWSRKKLVTNVSDSVASILYANPPIGRSSEFIAPLFRSDEVAAVSFESAMPKKGAQTSVSFSQTAPSQGRRRFKSLARLTSRPVDTLQKRSIKNTAQNIRRRSSASLQDFDGGRKTIRRINDSPEFVERYKTSSSTPS